MKSEPEEGHRANVIQLFGRTSRRLHPSTDAPVAEATEVSETLEAPAVTAAQQ
ncbi:hypothetical protein EMGBS4_00140 [Acidimicrobiaceae bacterium]|nr:hypothetical protein EMGBS4_00140 [Acidimicrobiaceae bacterium]